MSDTSGKGAVTRTPWEGLRALTPARIALGRAGTSLPTAPHLEFQLAHARARKAVHLEIDGTALAAGIGALGVDTLVVESAAETRAIYLQRPDYGRRLSEAARARLPEGGTCDLAIVVGDGLSGQAVERNAIPLLEVLIPEIARRGWSLGPVAVVTQARVAIGDEIGARLGARMVLVLIGERPGLSSPDSLGAYLTHAPRAGLTDESRNCVSNIRPAGLGYAEAAHKLLFLMDEALRRGLTGIGLKDEAEALATPDTSRADFLLGG
ncbi:ethanolamine ammonia-lyase subunit EutC [Acidimangrovimonas sediminis]|uniref:ethanolamine ammonia-lyase subunit EutC n=1 Tax=Acidimangrovimonas sediminis TaxID=2056283 RepID=UPI000C7FDC03|nr:ethanolamine ammonia-lyase subunit EutC [Acidimangrovimonas sediminis]